MLLLALILSALASWGLTAALRRYAIRAQMLDHPNDRGSHTRSTPRGGGLAFVVTFAASSWAVASAGSGSARDSSAIAATALLIAGIGWWDDQRGLAARIRFVVHGVASLVVLVWVGGPELAREILPAVPSVLTMGLAVFYLVWMTNLFNFMDGIDGIASVQAITVCVAGALCCWLAAPHLADWRSPLLLAACCAGFLILNFPPAKIFMGDVGSGFLGYSIGALSLASLRVSELLLWSWLILMGCFLVDATLTLVRRVLRGEKFYLAHRSHAYQYASRLYKSHKVVTLAFGAINVFWLFPWALAVALGWINGVVALVIAYTPLVLLAFHYKAGDRAAQGDLA